MLTYSADSEMSLGLQNEITPLFSVLRNLSPIIGFKISEVCIYGVPSDIPGATNWSSFSGPIQIASLLI